MRNRSKGSRSAGRLAGVLLLLAGVAGMASFCSSSLQDVTVTSDNQAQLWEELQKSNELTGEERDLLTNYLARQDLGEGVYLPSGKSVREMIAEQRGFEAGTEEPGESEQASNEPSSKPAASGGASPASGSSGSGSSGSGSSGGGSGASTSSPKTSEPSEPPTPPPPTTVELPAGTTLKVRLEQPLSSKTNQSGQNFEASLEHDLMVGEHLVAPEGSRVIGRITNAKKSGKVKGRAQMSIRLDAIVADGKRYDLRTNTLAFQAQGSKKEDAKKIGIGAGVGAVIGAIAGGGKGAAIGTAIGAGAGTGAVLMTSGDEVEFGVEQLFEFKTDRAVEMNIIRQ